MNEASDFFDFRVVANVKTHPPASSLVKNAPLHQQLPLTTDKALELVTWALQQDFRVPLSNADTRAVMRKIGDLNMESYESIPSDGPKADATGFFRVQKFDGFLKGSQEVDLMQFSRTASKSKRSKRISLTGGGGSDAASVGNEDSLTKILQRVGSFDQSSHLWNIEVNRFRDLYKEALKQKQTQVALEAGDPISLQEPTVQIVE